MQTSIDWKLELVTIPVSDVDRAKSFYVEQIGFNADHDQRVNENLRFVQLTPHGSACSIAFGEGLTTAAPGSIAGLQMVVADIEVAHAELVERGAPVSAVEDLAWGRFVYFADPDGNRWAIQQLPPRNR
jgi:predicted enzyme related to lactoylglutathione lyase